MCSRGWAVLLVASVAAPALASEPADTAPKAPVVMDVAALIAGTRWVGTYHLPPHYPVKVELVGGVLRIVSRAACELRLQPGAGVSGSCAIIVWRRTYRGIYRLERGRLIICSGLREDDPRPRTFAATTHSDLFILEPAPSK